MSHLRGMVVRLRTENQKGAGTDDMIYIGVVGKGGGREFPLATKYYNDFERDTDVLYCLGIVWDRTAAKGAKKPEGSEPGGINNPSWYNVNLNEVDYVYIRKEAKETNSKDDAYKFDKVEVKLYGTRPQSRVFFTAEVLWLGREYGQIGYIPES
jgi:hypothetical protein